MTHPDDPPAGYDPSAYPHLVDDDQPWEDGVHVPECNDRCNPALDLHYLTAGPEGTLNTIHAPTTPTPASSRIAGRGVHDDLDGDPFLTGALAETQRVRAGLLVIATRGCEIFVDPATDLKATAGTCWTRSDFGRRTADAPYPQNRACDPCIARWVLDGRTLPTEADQHPTDLQPGTMSMPPNQTDPYLAEREALLNLEDVIRYHETGRGRFADRRRHLADALERLDQARDLGPNA